MILVLLQLHLGRRANLNDEQKAAIRENDTARGQRALERLTLKQIKDRQAADAAQQAQH